MRYFRMCQQCYAIDELKSKQSTKAKICRKCSYENQNKTKNPDYRKGRKKTYSQVSKLSVCATKTYKGITERIIPQKEEEKETVKEKIVVRKLNNKEKELIEQWLKGKNK